MPVKRTNLIVVLASLSLLFAGCRAHREHAEAKEHRKTIEVKAVNQNGDDLDFPSKQEFRQSYKLAPGAQVEVSGINGLLKVETADTDTAEVRIIRSARNEEDFKERNLLVEQQGNDLRIRMENNRKNSFWSMLGPRQDERQRAYLKLPRQIALNASGVNGRTDIGEIGGRVELSGINGKVTVARATGEADLSGINGNIAMTLAQLSKGIGISGVNGNIELGFVDQVNADIEVSGINGNVSAGLPNVTVQEKKRNSFVGRIGNGGARIEVSGVNGNVHLLPVKTSGEAAR